MPAVPVVTGIAKVGRDRVAVALDGVAWRTLPLEAAVATGLAEGVELDRPRARRLRAELRRVEARTAALRALSRRDHTAASLRSRLDARGVAPAHREAAVATLERAGLVDDARFAHGRAAALAGRGCGDAMIRDDLAARGVPATVAEEALATLEPEHERARRAVEALGASPRTLRRLAARGFGDEALEPLVAKLRGAELG